MIKNIIVYLHCNERAYYLLQSAFGFMLVDCETYEKCDFLLKDVKSIKMITDKESKLLQEK